MTTTGFATADFVALADARADDALVPDVHRGLRRLDERVDQGRAPPPAREVPPARAAADRPPRGGRPDPPQPPAARRADVAGGRPRSSSSTSASVLGAAVIAVDPAIQRAALGDARRDRRVGNHGGQRRPGFGIAGPTGSFAAYGDVSNVTMIDLMWLGRLEMIPVLVLQRATTGASRAVSLSSQAASRRAPCEAGPRGPA